MGEGLGGGNIIGKLMYSYYNKTKIKIINKYIHLKITAT